MGYKIVVVNKNFDDALKDTIRAAAEKFGCSVDFFWSDGPESAAEAADADIVYGFAPQTVAAAKNIKWLALSTAGVDAYVKPGVVPENCIITNSKGAFGLALAEHTVMVALMLVRGMQRVYRGMEAGLWPAPVPQRSIKDSRITLLGAGDIGSCTARRLKPFEPACITAVCRSGKSSEPAYDRVVPISELDDILPQTDILIMSLPSTPETVGILSAEKIARLPDDAFVINVGRGTAVDEAALIDALENDRLAGAALDVMAHEPLAADDPLRAVKNCILTPHIAGNLTVPYTRQTNVRLFCENLEKFCTGQPMDRVIDRNRGY